ncbi:MAG: hypothetical protein ACREEB_00200 [Caulobacteraceae bacterium]
MSGIKYAAAMLAAGGAVGAAAGVQAATIITATFNLPVGQPGVYISLDSTGGEVTADPEYSNFYYGLGTAPQTVFRGTFGYPITKDKGLIGETTTVPGLPAPGESYQKAGTYDVTNPTGVSPGVDEYVHLEFITDGDTYVGTAMFDGAGDLETVMYEAVPEPAEWMLLIAGAGLVGGALRGARRRRQAVAA